MACGDQILQLWLPGVFAVGQCTHKQWLVAIAGDMLNNLLNVVPELNEFANLHLKVAFNKDSSRVGPREWVELAKLLHRSRKHYDAFLVVHGTDTMAYTASALSLMLLGFRKPIVMTGYHSLLPVLCLGHTYKYAVEMFRSYMCLVIHVISHDCHGVGIHELKSINGIIVNIVSCEHRCLSLML